MSLLKAIQEAFEVNESSLEDALKQFSSAQRLPKSGSKIKAIKSAESKVKEEFAKLSLNELLQINKKSSIGSATAMYSAKELTSRAQEKLNKEADKNRKGDAGEVQDLSHAIEILTK